jgi:hypothetical protein
MFARQAAGDPGRHSRWRGEGAQLRDGLAAALDHVYAAFRGLVHKFRSVDVELADRRFPHVLHCCASRSPLRGWKMLSTEPLPVWTRFEPWPLMLEPAYLPFAPDIFESRSTLRFGLSALKGRVSHPKLSGSEAFSGQTRPRRRLAGIVYWMQEDS